MANGHTKYGLFASRRFMPLFLAAFLGALNDNILRSGLVVLIGYSAVKGITLPMDSKILVTLCSAILILPLLLFSSIAGSLADKFEKSRLVFFAKLAEIAIMAGAFYGFATDNIYLLMVLLFISGTHTAFYGPIKYSLLPEHVPENELLAANAFMASGGFLAVLFGMIIGGWLVLLPGVPIGIVLLAVAVVGCAASLFIPRSLSAHPDAHVDFNIWKGARTMMSYITNGDRVIFKAILALSWFLLVGSVYMAQFVNYAENVVRANNEVYIAFLATFSVGLTLGSVACDTLLKGQISTRLLPPAAFGVSLFTYLMVAATPDMERDHLVGIAEFLASPEHWLLFLCMMMVAVSGGLYMVPLYAILQSRANAQYRSRVMAASNFLDSLFMTIAAVVSTMLLAAGFGVLDLFLLLATCNLGVIYYARRLDS